MGKAKIISGGEGGQYTIRIQLDRTRVDARIARIDQQLSKISVTDEAKRLDDLNLANADLDTALGKLDVAISALRAEAGTEQQVKDAQAEVVKNWAVVDRAQAAYDAIRLQRVSLTKEKEFLQESMPDDPEVTAWCADLTASLSGEVGTIEVPGERKGVPVIIRPGFDGTGLHTPARDGQLQPSIASVPAAVFWNWAMLPGWQKWKPTYRVGVLTAVDHETDTADVALDSAYSSAQSLNVNQSGSLSGVPIQYMDCDADPFEVGDRVVVEFTGRDFAQPKVIGFESNPKPCGASAFLGHPRDNTQNLGPYLFERASPAAPWTAQSTSYVGGNVDWKGNATSDILTWHGPMSRYWLPYGKFGFEAHIWRNGALWASVPEGNVIGCAIMTYSGTRYLNAAVVKQGAGYEADLRIYQRVESETYPDNGMYDAGTNPLGWKLIYTETLDRSTEPGVPTTIFAFNGSGTECQGICGDIGYSGGPMPQAFKNRTKLTISGETVTVERFDARGHWNRYEDLVGHTDYSLDVTHGTIQPATPPATGCYIDDVCEATGPCSGGGTACIDSKVEYDNGWIETQTADGRVDELAASTVCVDYQGDREVIGRFRLSGTEDNDYSETFDQHYFRYMTRPDCESSWSESSDQTWSFASTSTVNQDWNRWTLEFNDFVFEVRNVGSRTETTTKEENGSSASVAGSYTYTGDRYNGSPSDPAVDRQILFLDLRYTHVVYSEKIRHEVSSASGSGACPYTPYITQYEDLRLAQMAILGGADPVELWEETTVLQDYSSQPGVDIQCVGGVGEPVKCDGAETHSENHYTPGNVSAYDIYDYGDRFGAHIHEEVRDYSVFTYRQGCVTDRQGNVFASFLIWEDNEPADPRFTPTVDNDVWNYLTGGDPVALTGLSDDWKHFWPISIL